MDADTYKYIAGKKGDLEDKGIDKDAYCIFFPDFVTANFGVKEIIEAFENFFEDFKNKIEEKGKQKVNLVNKDKEELLEKLNNKTEEEKFEDIIEEFLKIKLNNPNYKLKKTQYAEHLATVLRKNLSLGVKRYPFEDPLGKFIKKIQKRQFPDLDF